MGELARRRLGPLPPPEDKWRTQAAMIWHKTTIEGKSMVQAAKEMNMSSDTAHKRMAQARKANMFVTMEEKIYTQLLEKAHQALNDALEDGDAQVALAIYKGVGLLSDKKGGGFNAQQQEEDFYGEIARIRAGDVTQFPGFESVDVEAIESAGAEVDVEEGFAEPSGVQRQEEGPEIEGEDCHTIAAEADDPEDQLKLF